MPLPLLLRAVRQAVPPVALLPFLLLWSVPRSAPAQNVTATQVVHFEVRPVLAVRELSPMRVVARTAGSIDVATTVVVDANTAYRVIARAADSVSDGAYVRTADGSFASLAPAADITVAVEHRRGRTTHDVVCRVAASRTTANPVTGCAIALQFVLDDAGGAASEPHVVAVP